MPGMQNEAAEKLDELLTVLDVSDEIKKMGEHKAVYNTREIDGQRVNHE